MASLGDNPTDLTPHLREVAARNGRTVTGTLAAIVPDTRATFEAFVRGLSPNSATSAKRSSPTRSSRSSRAIIPARTNTWRSSVSMP